MFVFTPWEMFRFWLVYVAGTAVPSVFGEVPWATFGMVNIMVVLFIIGSALFTLAFR